MAGAAPTIPVRPMRCVIRAAMTPEQFNASVNVIAAHRLRRRSFTSFRILCLISSSLISPMRATLPRGAYVRHTIFAIDGSAFLLVHLAQLFDLSDAAPETLAITDEQSSVLEKDHRGHVTLDAIARTETSVAPGAARLPLSALLSRSAVAVEPDQNDIGAKVARLTRSREAKKRTLSCSASLNSAGRRAFLIALLLCGVPGSGQAPFGACYPPKVHDGTQTLRCLICSMSHRNNKLRG